ncbi:hypothetical protein [Flavobacterium sp. Root186]|uniref:hypothetical protein n=1 Tax=Flavobacterium sp. Root186 TaxID=1736485 RepID=UPI0006F4C34B|nr:hypothetical protein [Flavobacterium sp. Root186]KRB56968.1 hypothetical protein ASD98_09845 [Flavobacterium sp. Root186]
MKKILTLFAVVGLFAFTGCEGPEGPQGPPGYDAPVSEVIEREVDFTSNNGYLVTVPLTPAIYKNDVVLVYHLYAIQSGNDVWRLMPQTYYMTDGGALDFNFDYTLNRVNIFLGADFPLNTLSPDWTQDQIFRIVIVPADIFETGKSINKADYSDYNAVIKKYKLDDSNVKRIKL